MSIVVYCLSDAGTPHFEAFKDNQMSEALAKCQYLRQAGFTHVCMSSELEGQVGRDDKGGVVADGKLPNGDTYEWSKAHRAGAKSQKEVIKK